MRIRLAGIDVEVTDPEKAAEALPLSRQVMP